MLPRHKKILSFFILLMFLTAKLYSPNKVSAACGDAGVPNIGPEIAVAAAGTSVIGAQNYNGVVAVINYLNQGETTATNTVEPNDLNPINFLRVDIDSHTSDENILAWISSLNTNGDTEFPCGVGAIVVSVEANNLDWWGTPGGDLYTEGRNYGAKYNLFAQNVDRSKYKLIPAPPDLFNSVYPPQEWIKGFLSVVSCDSIDAQAADIFELPATAVPGYTWDNVWKWQQETICNNTKPVIHFEGWGMNPNDPPPEARDQVEWYQTHDPAVITEGQVSTATTLIVPICNGKRMDPYWWYYLHVNGGEVYDVNGNLIDVENCTGLSGYICNPSGADYPDKYLDWHTLRPLPMCPYYPTPNDLDYYMCGHDLVTSESFSISFEEKDQYYQIQDGILLNLCDVEETDTAYIWNCAFSIIDRGIGIKAYVDGLDFPVMGLTEPDYVANIGEQTYEDYSKGYVTHAQKMNEYVSWYMNGVTGRGEYEYPQANSDGSLKQKYKTLTVDQSGPLRKQLPWRIQVKERVDEIIEAMQRNPDGSPGSGKYNTPNDENLRYRKIVACNFQYDLPGIPYLWDGDVGYIPIACIKDYYDKKTKIELPGILPDLNYAEVDRTYVSSWADGLQENLSNLGEGGLRIPPFDDDSSFYDSNGKFNFKKYWKAYLDWRGQDCTFNVVGIYICVDVPTDINLYANLFYYVPFTSTDDLTGHAWTDGTFTTQPPSDVAVTNVHFVPTPSDSNPEDGTDRYLYFPHMDEGAQLAQIDQGTYVPYDYKYKWLDEGGYTPNPNEVRNQIYNTDYCELLVNDINPGDRLQDPDNGIDAELDQYGIEGDLTYSGAFSCTWIQYKPVCGGFAWPGQTHCNLDECVPYTCQDDGSWVAAGDVGTGPCSGLPGACVSSSTYSEPPVGPDCEITVKLAISMYDAVPKIQEVYDRYVNGSMSIFKRIYPLVGEEGGVIKQIFDLPAKSHFNAIYTSEGDTTLAGDPLKNRPGNKAEFFWPHLGSVYYYFIKGIQYAYRPQQLIEYVLPKGGQVDIGWGDGNTNNGGTGNNNNQFPSIECPTSIPNLESPGSGIVCEPVNCLDIPDSAVPSEWLGTIKTGAISLAERWVASGGENSNASTCYNDTVVRSLQAGINPIYSLAIWIQESDASNYDSNVTFCDPAYPARTVQDFGINNLNFPGNYDAQVKQFLRLPYVYAVNYPQCFTDGCNIATFSRVFQQGASGDCQVNAAALSYANKTLNTMKLIWSACQPKYPTDMSCTP